jgi:hypothetical protein
MVQATVDLRALVKAIQEDPTKLQELLTRNPGIASMLANVYSDMARAPGSNLAGALNTLPEVPELANEFKQPILTNPAVKAAQLTNEYKVVANLEHGKFELRLGTDSALEWKITYKYVEPGKTEEKAQLLAAELNEKLAEKVAALPYKAQMPNGWKVYLTGHCKMPEVDRKQNLVVEGTTLIDDSFNRHRTQTVKVNGEDRSSHNEFLRNRGQTFVDNHSTRIAIAFFRYFGGFPIALGLIGTREDTGDLAQGKGVRTEIEGSYSGSAKSYQAGVGDDRWVDGDRARDVVGVFGLPPRNQNN